MMTANGNWELTILHDLPLMVYRKPKLSSLAIADLDSDGKPEIVSGGQGALLWLRPHTGERGIIAEGLFYPGSAIEDVDGDGVLEVVTSCIHPATSIWTLVWFKPGRDLYQPWQHYILDPICNGGSHDMLFTDIDGDGKRELVTNHALCDVPGLYIYKPTSDPAAPWFKHEVVTRVFAEGLAVADLNGDGQLEIVHGPDWFACPPDGPYAGPWRRTVYAPTLREMCRTAVLDVTGNGHPDIIVTESEYMNGRMAWFENRLQEDPEQPWIQHDLDRGLVYAHSMAAWYAPGSRDVQVLAAEMPMGGWGAPYNWNARLTRYSTGDRGASWQRDVIYRGAGTHQAMIYDLDGDGDLEIIGEANLWPQVQIWKERSSPSPLAQFHHIPIDRDRPGPATDILAVAIDGDGVQDVACGSWWYKNPSWERNDIPGVTQVLAAYDLDGDGRPELIGIRGQLFAPSPAASLSNELCWLKPVDGGRGWQVAPIGAGTGDWPASAVVAPVLTGEKLALIVTYHDGESKEHYPELFEIPRDPTAHPWPKRVLTPIAYAEDIVPCDIDGDGKLDLVAGANWLENNGNGTFTPHQFAEGVTVGRTAIADINGDGRPDIVIGEAVLDQEHKTVPFSRLLWFENRGDPHRGPWPMHIIDSLRCPHSLSVADLDGDGELEIICGEHDPFWPYRSQCRLYVYKKAAAHGRAWRRYTIDDRFEHRNGAKVIELGSGRLGIISHGWTDSRYVHLWETESVTTVPDQHIT